MADLIQRANATDLEVRSSGDGRTIVGIAVPFDSPTDIADAYGNYRETFKKGAFARTIAERGPQAVKVLALHDKRVLPLGRAQLLREDAHGLYSELKVSKTTQGDEVLELVRDGALDALSIGFSPVRDKWGPRRASVERLEVKLREISVVPFPAYAGAAIAGVRAATPHSLEVARRRLDLALESWLR